MKLLRIFGIVIMIALIGFFFYSFLVHEIDIADLVLSTSLVICIVIDQLQIIILESKLESDLKNFQKELSERARQERKEN